MSSSLALAPVAPAGGLSVMRVLRGLGEAMLAAFVFFACFAFSDVSPYDLVAPLAMLIWLGLGIRLYRGAVPFLALLLLYLLAIVTALVPYFDESVPVTWTVQLVYLAATGIFFAMFFSEETESRMELALKAYTASCLFSAVLGILVISSITSGLAQALSKPSLWAGHGSS